MIDILKKNIIYSATHFKNKEHLVNFPVNLTINKLTYHLLRKWTLGKARVTCDVWHVEFKLCVTCVNLSKLNAQRFILFLSHTISDVWNVSILPNFITQSWHPHFLFFFFFFFFFGKMTSTEVQICDLLNSGALF